MTKKPPICTFSDDFQVKNVYRIFISIISIKVIGRESNSIFLVPGGVVYLYQVVNLMG